MTRDDDDNSNHAAFRRRSEGPRRNRLAKGRGNATSRGVLLASLFAVASRCLGGGISVSAASAAATGSASSTAATRRFLSPRSDDDILSSSALFGTREGSVGSRSSSSSISAVRGLARGGSTKQPGWFRNRKTKEDVVDDDDDEEETASSSASDGDAVGSTDDREGSTIFFSSSDDDDGESDNVTGSQEAVDKAGEGEEKQQQEQQEEEAEEQEPEQQQQRYQYSEKDMYDRCWPSWFPRESKDDNEKDTQRKDKERELLAEKDNTSSSSSSPSSSVSSLSTSSSSDEAPEAEAPEAEAEATPSDDDNDHDQGTEATDRDEGSPDNIATLDEETVSDAHDDAGANVATSKQEEDEGDVDRREEDERKTDENDGDEEEEEEQDEGEEYEETDFDDDDEDGDETDSDDDDDDDKKIIIMMSSSSPPPPPSPPRGRYYRRPGSSVFGGGGGAGNAGGTNTGIAGGYPPPDPATAKAVLITEIVGTLLVIAVRLWALTSVAKWLATREETIHPTQHFVWERLNDRYVRDESSLQRVVSEPPSGVPHMLWNVKNWRGRTSSYKRRGGMPRSAGAAASVNLDRMFSRTVVVIELDCESHDGLDLHFLSDAITFLLQQHRNHAFGTRKVEVRNEQDDDDKDGNDGHEGANGDDKKRKRRRRRKKRAWSEIPTELEVLFLITSPGGEVSTYGLAASQIQRLKSEGGITVTACVDMSAASGGYMMASQANRIVAAPFAIVGSIGVYLEGMNFHDLLKQYNVKPLVIKSGDSKNPVTAFGEVTERDIEIERENIEKIHESFKDLVLRERPQLADKLDTVADGNIFLGLEAVELNLVDDVMTSDEYVLDRLRCGDRVLKLHRSHQGRFHRRFNLSPLDVLPHLKNAARWTRKNLLPSLSSATRTTTEQQQQAQDLSLLISRLILAGGYVGFIKHVADIYCSRSR